MQGRHRKAGSVGLAETQVFCFRPNRPVQMSLAFLIFIKQHVCLYSTTQFPVHESVFSLFLLLLLFELSLLNRCMFVDDLGQKPLSWDSLNNLDTDDLRGGIHWVSFFFGYLCADGSLNITSQVTDIQIVLPFDISLYFLAHLSRRLTR